MAVTISFHDLSSDPSEGLLFDKLNEAFGPGSLGLLTVSDIPNIKALRDALLPLGQCLADLPEDVLASLEDPESRWSFGWSRGREQLESGRPDFAKGSFYANPTRDVPTTDAVLIAEFPGYCRPNIWPHLHLPQLRDAFRAACAAIMDGGQRLAAHCDAFVARAFPGHRPSTTMSAAIRDSPCTKARLLHYYPPAPAAAADESEPGDGHDAAPWCSIHTDHGALTGLLSAAYIAKGAHADAGAGKLAEVPSPDPAAGLYVRRTDGTDVQVRIPADHVAYQLGEVMQVLSGGLLRATPHYVRAPAADIQGARNVSRNTLACFMQPSWTMKLEAPEGVDAAQTGILKWEPCMTFGRFSEITFASYY